jgi:hypothetical protein
MTPLIAAALAAVLVGYVLGRLRPWRMLGDWAADELHFARRWATGSRARQATLAAAVVVTEPRQSWQNWKRSGWT